MGLLGQTGLTSSTAASIGARGASRQGKTGKTGMAAGFNFPKAVEVKLEPAPPVHTSEVATEGWWKKQKTVTKVAIIGGGVVLTALAVYGIYKLVKR